MAVRCDEPHLARFGERKRLAIMMIGVVRKQGRMGLGDLGQKQTHP